MTFGEGGTWVAGYASEGQGHQYMRMDLSTGWCW